MNDYVLCVIIKYHTEKNGSVVLAFINQHGFLYNPTFRVMRS
ncbi:MAG: hypothetical protein AB8V03_07620 [Francisella endosymbiont of Hyalomma asiaticum]